MIEGFEEETASLSEYELKLVAIFVRGLQTKVGLMSAITGREMIKAMTASGYKVNGPRVRKIINYIRMHGLVDRLVANNAGYYVSEDEDELRRYAESLRSRAYAIDAIRERIESQIAAMQTTTKQDLQHA
jgi:hypothetical protein